MLGGLVPGVTVTVRSVESPGNTEFGFAVPVPVGLVEARTVREIEPLPVRDPGLVSVIVKGRFLLPPLVPLATVAENEKTLSFGVTSPFDPLSKKDCVAEPPIAERFATTACVKLAGLVPGVTVTVRSVVWVGATELGFAAPTPLGFVEVATLVLPFGVSAARVQSPAVSVSVPAAFRWFVLVGVSTPAEGFRALVLVPQLILSITTALEFFKSRTSPPLASPFPMPPSVIVRTVPEKPGCSEANPAAVAATIT